MIRNTQEDKRKTKTGKIAKSGKIKLSSRFVTDSYRGRRREEEE